MVVPVGVTRSRSPGQLPPARSRRPVFAASRTALLIAVVKADGHTPSRGFSGGFSEATNRAERPGTLSNNCLRISARLIQANCWEIRINARRSGTLGDAPAGTIVFDLNPLNGIQEVVGSIPIGSAISSAKRASIRSRDLPPGTGHSPGRRRSRVEVECHLVSGERLLTLIARLDPLHDGPLIFQYHL